MDHICDFTVEVSFEGSGLLGKTHEYNPYLGYHGTFGKHKMEEKATLIPIGKRKRELKNSPKEKNQGEGIYDYDDEVITYRTSRPMTFQLPNHGSNTRIDENVWFELFCHTRDSGIPEMDKRQAKYLELQSRCGVVPLNVEEIIRTYKELGCTANYFTKVIPVVDQKIVDFRVRELAQHLPPSQRTREKYNELIQKVSMETMKGVLTFHIKMNEFHERNFSQSVYGMPNFQKSSISATLPFSTSFHRKEKTKFHSTLGTLPGGGGGRGKERDFTPISYTSAMGVEKMLGTMQNAVVTPYCEHFIPMENPERAPLCAPLNHGVSRLQMWYWASGKGDVPTANYWSCNDPTTRIYPNEEMRLKDLELYGFNEKTERFFLRIMRAALRRQGMSEELFVNEINHHFSLQNKSPNLSEQFLACEDTIANITLPSGDYMADLRYIRMGLNGRKAKMIITDSWDRGLTEDISHSDDCDGEEEFDVSVIRAMSYGRHTLGYTWESPLLNAVKLYLKYSLIYDNGATVTSAYLDTNGDRIETKMKDLPLIGDSVDLNSQSDGHCHGFMGSWTDAIKRMENGNIAPEKLAKIRAFLPQSESFLKRDGQRTILVLEATGAMAPRILPIEESYQLSKCLTMKAKATKNWTKSVRVKLEERKKNGQMDIGDCFSMEGQPHYSERQDPRRKISAFYNEVVHATSQELWKFDISLSQMAFGKKTGPNRYEYGAKIADFIRHPSDYALIFPFNHLKEEWEKDVLPMMESVQHQQAIMSFGRYSDEKYEMMEKSSSPPQPEMEQFLSEVSTQPNLSIVRLQTRQWRLDADKAKAEEMKKFLSSMPGLVKIGYFTEHHIPVCHPVIEILCVIQVDACLEMTFPQK